tara:strand:+ start:590 stop:2443 length:1854 start_codon:yes stop_codon:yes gene_type:complete
MPTTTLSTTLLESVNIVLANLGESPVNSIADSASIPPSAALAKGVVDEVAREVQSKGWWFNQKTGANYSTTADVTIYPSNSSGEWSADIPEEARRYITIRAARVLQSRLIGSEELQKFSYNEELISLAFLQQAHVRNSNGVLDFASFPAELRSLGVDEVMFLQGSVEEKIGTLRLGGELANTAKTKAETSLIGEQEDLVEAQTLTEAQTTLKVTAETSLIGEQEDLVEAQTLTEAQTTLKVTAETSLIGEQEDLVEAQELKVDAETSLIGEQEDLVEAQTLTEAENTLKVVAETSLIGEQEDLVEAQTLTEAENTLKVVAETSLIGEQEDLVEAQELKVDAETALLGSQKVQLDAQTAIASLAEKAFYEGVLAGSQSTYRDYAAEMRIMGIQEGAFQAIPAYKKKEIISDATKLRAATATESGTDATELAEVNKVMRFIGEPPIAALNSHSLASEAVRLMRDTHKELQGRGWWFNTEEGVEFSTDGSDRIVVADDTLSIEANEYSTRVKTVGASRYLYDLEKKSYQQWTSTIKAKVIYNRSLDDTPDKYLEYLNVRVALLLTELYPQSGGDVQRLPKMEQELRAYFKDREGDEANYTVFDNYDAASRIGINRRIDIA